MRGRQQGGILAGRVQVVTGVPGYSLEMIREGDELLLLRGHRLTDLLPILGGNFAARAIKRAGRQTLGERVLFVERVELGMGRKAVGIAFPWRKADASL